MSGCECEWRYLGSFILVTECSVCAVADPFDGLTEEDQINE